ncbi:MAG: hypothetical protein LBP70_01470 [Mycoplasmataceae bacterium]|jgi:predicted metal-dependent hydrolase|nr:hypothetical protein [Mycoplasmataceae bacterium]
MEQLKNQVEGSVEKTTQKTFTQDEVNGLIAKEVAKALKDKTDASALEQVKTEAETYKKQYDEIISSQKQRYRIKWNGKRQNGISTDEEPNFINNKTKFGHR